MDPGEPGRQRQRQHGGRPERQPRPQPQADALLLAEDIADPPQRVDQRPVEAPVHLVPQPVDVDVDDVGQAVELEVPDVLQDHRPADDLAGVPHQVVEQGELLGRQVDPPPGPLDDAGRRGRAAGRPPGGSAARRSRPAPEHDPDAGQQLGERERLDQVVVGAGVEPLDPVADGARAPSGRWRGSPRPARGAGGAGRGRRGRGASGRGSAGRRPRWRRNRSPWSPSATSRRRTRARAGPAGDRPPCRGCPRPPARASIDSH